MLYEFHDNKEISFLQSSCLNPILENKFFSNNYLRSYAYQYKIKKVAQEGKFYSQLSKFIQNLNILYKMHYTIYVFLSNLHRDVDQ